MPLNCNHMHKSHHYSLPWHDDCMSLPPVKKIDKPFLYFVLCGCFSAHGQTCWLQRIIFFYTVEEDLVDLSNLSWKKTVIVFLLVELTIYFGLGELKIAPIRARDVCFKTHYDQPLKSHQIFCQRTESGHQQNSIPIVFRWQANGGLLLDASGL